MADAADFARDLGYLGRFFDRLEAHAATLTPASAARLRTLVAEERGRWAEIQALVAGAPGPASPQPNASPPATLAPPTHPRPTPGALTVGSLLGVP